MNIIVPHPWKLTAKEATAWQLKLAQSVVISATIDSPQIIAAVDCAVEENNCLADVVLWDIKKRSLICHVSAIKPLSMPYIPGLLSFRELPAVLAAFEKLKHTPDLILCDGQGIAHPRRFGIACHLGVLTDLPSVGCAKEVLVGEYYQLADDAGSHTPLFDRGERIGCMLRTKLRTKPVVVSPGHRCTLEQALQWVQQLVGTHRLPEPLWWADRLSKQLKTRYVEKELHV